MAQLISVKLSRFDGSPWGFRLQGGKDFGTPLVVQKVNGGSPAEAAGLRAGDAVIRVNNTDMFSLRHKDAQDVIVRAGNNFEVTIQRGGSTWKPSVTPVSATLPSPQPTIPAATITPVTKTSLAAKKQEGPLIGSGHNFSPKPFLNGNGEGPIKSIVNKQYNSPVGIYSEETIAETLSAQAEVLAGGVLGVNFKKNEKNYNAEKSEVFKMVQEADKEPRSPEPAEPSVPSNVATSPIPAVSGLRHVSAPETKAQPTTPQPTLPPGQNICADCERLIVGVFVRIKEKNLHVECFKCSTCGTSLKNVGYYNINNKLYCDIHAKLVARQNAPSGLSPIVVPPGAKAPAGTISAALANVGAGAPLAPLSPSLNNHSSPLPFSTCIRPNANNVQAGFQRLHTDGFAPDVRLDGNREVCDGNNSRTFRSTLTIQTGNEVGSTNGSKLLSYNNHTNEKLNQDPKNPKIGELCEIVFNPVIAEDSSGYTDPVKVRTYPSQKQSARLGTSPVSPPSLRPVQAPSSNSIGGPKAFGGSTTPNLASSPILNSGSNTLPRPQSQSVTETYFEESDYYEETESQPEFPPSVRSKSLVWPPTKSIEEITYPTASPLYINPNPALNQRHQQLVRKKQKIQEIEVQEKEEETIIESRAVAMENVSCPGPVYRRVEFVGVTSQTQTRPWENVKREESIPRESLPRPESREGLRRSLTPTRITQPVPQPWTATVTSGSNLYEHTYPVQEQQTCQRICQRQQQVCLRKQVCPEPPCQILAQPQPIVQQEIQQEESGTKLSEVVPANIAVCPEGVDGQHEYFTETMEKDVGPLHIKKTTTYEKTVEIVDPEETAKPKVDEVDDIEETEVQQYTSSETEFKYSKYDQEVEDISGRKSVAESAVVVAAAVDTQQLIEKIKREEEERLAEERAAAAQQISTTIPGQTVQERRQSSSEVQVGIEHRFSSSDQGQEDRRQSYANERRTDEREILIQQQILEERRQSLRDQIDAQEQAVQERRQSLREQQEIQQVAEEKYQELTEEIKIQESYMQEELEEQRRQSLREQVQVHQSLREQQVPEKRQQTLQERRLSTRFVQQTVPQEPQSTVENTCSKKHVQFVTQTESGVQPLPPTMIQNSTPKQWQSEMVKALTTAPYRPYSPLVATAVDEQRMQQSYSEQASYEHITQARSNSPFVQALSIAPNDRYVNLRSEVSNELVVSTESTNSYNPSGQESRRPVSPFQNALTTAPDRPYTPLGDSQPVYIPPPTYVEEVQVNKVEYSSFQPVPYQETSVVCRRSRTPSVPVNVETEGYCHPAEILYTDTKTQEHMRRERSLSRNTATPQPLPTPPPDYRLRDSSRSPARSRSQTPSNRSMMTGLKKPDLIPSYQRNLVAMKKGPVESQAYIPSRSPTPTRGRSKSPAQGPPDPPACFIKAQAPKIRDDPPPKCKSQPSVSQYQPPPEQYQTVSYHREEDTPTIHKVQDYAGTRTVSYGQTRDVFSEGGQQVWRNEDLNRNQRHQHIESQDVSTDETFNAFGAVQQVKKTRHVTEDFERTQKNSVSEIRKSFDASACPKQLPIRSEITMKAGCLINQVSRSQPTVTCPIGNSLSDKFPKTGVRVLPPCPKSITSDQTYQKSAFCGTKSQMYHKTVSQSQPSAFCGTRPRTCPETGVTVLPCKATSDSGLKAGVVVVPCEGPSDCPQSGICVMPNADRTGLCVSPCYGLGQGSCGQPSGSCGRRSGSCGLDLGTSPQTGVCVAPCKDGSGALCVAPCSVPGVTSVQCPKPILKNQRRPPSVQKAVPFPQIPLPDEDDNEIGLSEPQIPEQRPSSVGFQPIQSPRTNLGNQLTLLTQKSSKSLIQVFKPQAQCQSQYQCPPLAPIAKTQNLVDPPNLSSHPDLGSGVGGLGAGSKSGTFAGSSAPKRGRGILNQQGGPGSRVPLCGHCNAYVRGPFITALGQIWCPDHFVCVNGQCRRPLQDIGFVEEKGQLYCEYCFEQFIAPGCTKCNGKIKGDCLNAIGKHFHPECFNCSYCGKLFGNNPFFLEDGLPYCEADWNELFTTKCFACGFPVEAGDRWVEALNNNYHSQCFNCTMCKKNLEGQSFYAKGGHPFCKNHAR